MEQGVQFLLRELHIVSCARRLLRTYCLMAKASILLPRRTLPASAAWVRCRSAVSVREGSLLRLCGSQDRAAVPSPDQPPRATATASDSRGSPAPRRRSAASRVLHTTRPACPVALRARPCPSQTAD